MTVEEVGENYHKQRCLNELASAVACPSMSGKRFRFALECVWLACWAPERARLLRYSRKRS